MDEEIIKLLNKEVVLALGCTEPIAVALATAKCREVLKSIPESVEVLVSPNIFKNGMGVGIPGTGMIGLNIAAALGAVGGVANKLLQVLLSINDDDIELAKKMIDDNKVAVKLKETSEKLYIEAICRSKNDCVKVIIKDAHTNITDIEFNGEKLFEVADSRDTASDSNQEKIKLTVDEIYNFAMTVSLDKVRFLLQGAEINKKLSSEALKNKYGLGVGKAIYENVNKGIVNDGIETCAKYITAAAVDARMAGCSYAVMTNSGSGNQGITVSLPVLAVAEKLGVDEEKTIRALAISNLVAIHIKSYLGRLSALCGCVVASTGASCGITYLLGGNLENIKFAIKNMIGDISGMVCDGAKCGCALKVSTGVSSAIQAAMLALNNIEISQSDGIIDKDVEKTIKNLCTLGNEGMKDADKVMLNIMTCK